MAIVAEQQGVSVAEYLEGEKATEIKHEYVNGTVYAMGGASREHNIISMNLGSALHGHLRGGPCQTFMADMKVHLRLGDDELFYYPDVVVGCDAPDNHRYYLERPRFVAEVLSPASERIDRREKFLAYTRLDSLSAYLLLEQERPAGVVYRRDADWRGEHLGEADTLQLPELEFSLPMAEIYAGVVTG
jgi:Uma2 family endonuclease